MDILAKFTTLPRIWQQLITLVLAAVPAQGVYWLSCLFDGKRREQEWKQQEERGGEPKEI